MKLREIFANLSYGELSNLSMSNEGSGIIIETAIPKLVRYINEGLLRLHSRFLLKEGNLLLVQEQHISYYHLLNEYAETSGSNQPYKYIKDLAGEPFEEDVLKILEVVDSTGQKRPLNDTQNTYSLFTPQPTTLQVPNPIHGQPLAILYQARHRKLDDKGDNFLDQEIVLPDFLETALQAYIAHKVYSHMNGPENTQKGLEFQAKYEEICLETESKDLVNNTLTTSHSKLEDRGFV